MATVKPGGMHDKQYWLVAGSEIMRHDKLTIWNRKYGLPAIQSVRGLVVNDICLYLCHDRILSVKAAVGTSRCLLWMLNIVKIIPNFVDTFSINLSPEHYCNTLYWRRWLWRGRAMAHWRGWAGRGTRATTSTRGPTPWPPSTSATRRTCTASSSKTRKPTKSCRWPPDWRECWMCGNQTTMELSKQEKPCKSKRKNSCCDWKRSLG